MSIVNIISAIGNNSTIYPLIVRDCGIEGPSKIILTYRQNAKESKTLARHATRERIIDEYGTSAVWLGGIPLVESLFNKFIKKFGIYPFINPELFKEQANQGLQFNINKFSEKAPEAVADLLKVKNNKKLYQKLLSAKFVAATGIPIVLMGIVLPKLNFKLTDKRLKETNTNSKDIDYKKLDLTVGEKFVQRSTKEKNINFKGLSSLLADMSQIQKMAITDGGLTLGRVGTARNTKEKIEMGFKMTAMMFVNYVTPKYIQKGLDSLSNKLFGINVNLDPLIITDKELIEQIKNNELKLPKDKNSVINFIDKNPKSKFTGFAKKFCGINFLKNTEIRDPRCYVDEQKVMNLANDIKKFADDAKKSNCISKYAKKAFKIKSANILSNIAISSLLLAVAIPKAQFVLRKIISGTDIDPGLLK